MARQNAATKAKTAAARKAAKAKADAEPEKITSIEIRVEADGASYGLDLLKLSIGEAKAIEAITGQKYGSIVTSFYFGEGLSLDATTAVAATAIRRIDDERSLADIIGDLDDLPVGGDDCLKLERVEDDEESDAVDPTSRSSEPSETPGDSGSQN